MVRSGTGPSLTFGDVVGPSAAVSAPAASLGKHDRCGPRPRHARDVDAGTLLGPGLDLRAQARRRALRRTAHAGRSGKAVLAQRQGPRRRRFPRSSTRWPRPATTDIVVDGEVVAFAGRRTSFERLQGRLGITDPAAARRTGIPVFYYVFDLLRLDGTDTRRLPLLERKKLLRTAIRFDDPLRFTVHRIGSGEQMYRAACARGDEGVVAKRAAAAYTGGRSKDWLKFKCVRDQELVIGGWTEPKGSRSGLGALLVGYHDSSGALVYAGKVGTGFTAETLRATVRRTRSVGAGRFAVPYPRPGARCALGTAGTRRPDRLRRVDPGRPAAASPVPGTAHRQGRGRRGTRDPLTVSARSRAARPRWPGRTRDAARRRTAQSVPDQVFGSEMPSRGHRGVASRHRGTADRQGRQWQIQPQPGRSQQSGKRADAHPGDDAHQRTQAGAPGSRASRPRRGSRCPPCRPAWSRRPAGALEVGRPRSAMSR